MNFPLARELYGQPWCMDSNSLPGLLGTLSMIRNGVNLEIPEIKYNTPQLLTITNETRIITRPFGNDWVEGELENNDKFEGIGIININGPITVNGGQSTIGMEQLSAMMMLMAQDSRMVGFIIKANSGGGASSAVDIMVDTINEIKKTKPVYGLVTKGGMAASAMYMILTACTKIYAESGMSIVGSNGTMIQFDGSAANSQDSEGNKRIRLYATKSTMKNKDFEEALNNDNYEPIISQLLDPINEHGLARSLANRPQLEGTDYDNGHTIFAKNGIGTFIDGIASFDQVVSMVEAESSIITSTNNSNNNFNTNNMTRTELQNQHPAVYSEILAEGQTAERERVNSWMAWSKVDSVMVAEGIKSGKEISPSQREELLVKSTGVQRLENLKEESHGNISTEESKSGVLDTASEAKKKEIEAAFDFDIKAN